jgi:hypothetical protein
MRNLAALVIVLSVPVHLFALGYGLNAINDDLGFGWFAVCCFGVTVASFGIALLLDAAWKAAGRPPRE